MLHDLTKDDETCSQGCGGGTTAGSLESQEHGGNGQDTADGGEQTHGNVWHTGLQVVLANVLEIEVAVESTQPAGQGNKHLCERRVNVHEELALDVLGRESTEAEITHVSGHSEARWGRLTGLHRRQRC
jgi:hypothetical protein